MACPQSPALSPHTPWAGGRVSRGRCPRKSLYLGSFTTCWPAGFLAASLQNENRGFYQDSSGPRSGHGVAWPVDMDFIVNMPSLGTGLVLACVPAGLIRGRQTLGSGRVTLRGATGPRSRTLRS